MFPVRRQIELGVVALSKEIEDDADPQNKKRVDGDIEVMLQIGELSADEDTQEQENPEAGQRDRTRVCQMAHAKDPARQITPATGTAATSKPALDFALLAMDQILQRRASRTRAAAKRKAKDVRTKKAMSLPVSNPVRKGSV